MSTEYTLPVKKVKNPGDMILWQKSKAFYDIIGFINGISVVVQGKKTTDTMVVSETMKNLLRVLDILNDLILRHPPIDQPQRFGNQAFRSWYAEVKNNCHKYLCRAIPEEYHLSMIELNEYFKESFGNDTRIDYGTGHELAFVMFMCCLFKVKILHEEDNVACCLLLFNKYLELVRKLQKIYRMEPAGSQGVWSLDDYQFMPFIWGSAQLAMNTPFDPPKFLDDDVIQEYKDKYMYIGCIHYILEVKTGMFAEHSNQLWSISAVPTWSTINSGLVKMYQKEILSKFPVIQHVLFGNLLPLEAVKQGTHLSTVRLGIPHGGPAKRPAFHPTKEPEPEKCDDNVCL